MHHNKIKITEIVEKTSTFQRFGGYSFLPESFEWPVNSNGEKLTLVFSIPSVFLNEYCDTNLDENKWISVFSTYNDDYFLDEVIDNGDVLDVTEKIFGNFTQVILHNKGEARNESDYMIPSYLIEVVSNLSNIELENSKIGGYPIYLQNEVKEAECMKFCFQFYTGNLPVFQNILFLEDAICYLFILDNDENFEGLFFGQCT